MALTVVIATLGLLSGIGTAGATNTPKSIQRVDRAQVAATAVLEDINAVRKKFGLPTGAATTAFETAVSVAARQLRDPALSIASAPPKTVDEDGVWGAITTTGSPASLDPSEIVNTWVYKDGWRGKATLNEDCTSPTAPGCDGHRRAILRAPPKPGAKLMIDVYAANLPINGAHGLSIAAVFNWTAP